MSEWPKELFNSDSETVKGCFIAPDNQYIDDNARYYIDDYYGGCNQYIIARLDDQSPWEPVVKLEEWAMTIYNIKVYSRRPEFKYLLDMAIRTRGV
jgi:hypothetical protein